MFHLSRASWEKLTGVHPELVAVAALALTMSPVDFKVTEGLRDLERQRKLMAEGKSRTLNSRHLTGHAIDIAAIDGAGVTWEWGNYEQIAEAMKRAADQLGIRIEWGGDWDTFKDGTHFQLARVADQA